MRTCIALLAFALCGVRCALAVAQQAPQASVPRPEHGYFSAGAPRFFLSSKSDLGVAYLKPAFAVGYGKPHWIWIGIDASAILTPDLFQSYAGVRAALPVLDLAFGIQDTWALHRPFLAPARAYTKTDIDQASGPNARAWGWEAEATGVLPLPHSALVADFILAKLLDLPDSRSLYSESYRAIVADSMFAVLRVAAVARLLNEDALKIGVLGEHIFETGRERGVVRVGPAAALQLSDHLEALGTLTFTVSSPDSLGLVHGAYGILGLRYRWATGEAHPKAPWVGPWIPF